ncbi:hypothetical protein [Streptomyces sp. NPDC096012]|uniref:hypothetical protein n=1 Tax=Streptomyces sp. NPDC096012 TaxID=3155684 RepID=UPI00336ABA66
MKRNFAGRCASVRIAAAVIATAVALLGAVTAAGTAAKPQHVSAARADDSLLHSTTNPWS